MTIEELFGTLQQSVVATWRKHLRTHKYSKHMALDEFYNEMPEKVDALIEAWMGENGKKVNSFNNVIVSKNMGTLAYLKELKRVCREGYELMNGKAELEALLDDIIELINSTMYKVKELNESEVKDLSDYINEALINEANPRGTYRVVEPFSTSFAWESYSYINGDLANHGIDEEEIEPIVDETEFSDFLRYAKKKRWKKDVNGYYIIPRRTILEYVNYVDCAPHLGLFEINGDGVYISLPYDGLKYGEYDDYLKPADNDDYEDW